MVTAVIKSPHTGASQQVKAPERPSLDTASGAIEIAGLMVKALERIAEAKELDSRAISIAALLCPDLKPFANAFRAKNREAPMNGHPAQSMKEMVNRAITTVAATACSWVNGAIESAIHSAVKGRHRELTSCSTTAELTLKVGGTGLDTKARSAVCENLVRGLESAVGRKRSTPEFQTSIDMLVREAYPERPDHPLNIQMSGGGTNETNYGIELYASDD